MIEQIRSSLKEQEAKQTASVIETPDKKPKLEVWQQNSENGEYLRAAKITEEQNNNMIDGTMNNRHRAAAGEAENADFERIRNINNQREEK